MSYTLFLFIGLNFVCYSEFRYIYTLNLRTFSPNLLHYLRTFLRKVSRISPKVFTELLLFTPNFSTELSSFTGYFSRALFTPLATVLLCICIVSLFLLGHIDPISYTKVRIKPEILLKAPHAFDYYALTSSIFIERYIPLIRGCHASHNQ